MVVGETHHFGNPPNHVAMPVCSIPLPLTPFHRATFELHSAATGHRAAEVVAAQRSPANRQGQKIKEATTKSAEVFRRELGFFYVFLLVSFQTW